MNPRPYDADWEPEDIPAFQAACQAELDALPSTVSSYPTGMFTMEQILAMTDAEIEAADAEIRGQAKLDGMSAAAVVRKARR